MVMVADIIPSSHTWDMSSALVLLNSILLGVIGFLLRDAWSSNKTTKLKTDQNERDIQLFKQQIRDKVELMEKLVERDLRALNMNVQKLAESIDTLHQSIERKDADLMQDMKQTIKDLKKRDDR